MAAFSCFLDAMDDPHDLCFRHVCIGGRCRHAGGGRIVPSDKARPQSDGHAAGDGNIIDPIVFKTRSAGATPRIQAAS